MNNIPEISSSFEFAACGLVTTEVNGKICRANATFCKWLGFSADDLIENKKIQELFTIGGRFFHHTHWAPLLQLQGSVTEVQMDVVAKDGAVLPMLINVVRQKQDDTSFDHVAFFIVNDRKSYERELITARKSVEDSLVSLRNTQNKLQESQDFLSIAMRSARMGVWSQNLETSQVLWSPELQQLTGLIENKHWEKSQDFYQLIHADDLSKFIAELQAAIESQSDYDIQFRLKHIDGNWLSMEGRGHATYSEEGEAISIFGVFIDISERKAAAQKLHELNIQLSIADRRKDEFLATLGHELRNPLAPMRNVLELMRRKETDDSFMQWSREIIERHVLQMTHLVDDLMETSRITQGRLELRNEPNDISDLMQNAIESTHTLMQNAKHTFTVHKPETAIIIEADATRITQIITNLLANAAKYTPAGGNICLSAYIDKNEAVISVVDSGIGIPSEQLLNIFSMFSQLTPALERSQGGLGIGLALVHGLVQLHGGSIVAHSEGEGKGSEFIVRLPLYNSPSEKMPIAKKTAPILLASKRILVIEDNLDTAESLTKLLEFSGHSAQSAHDGMSGITTAEAFNPDVILLDIGLPDINGYEVAQRIRQQSWGKKMFLIAATGWGQDKDKELAKKAGFNKHLTKPIDYQELVSILHSIAT